MFDSTKQLLYVTETSCGRSGRIGRSPCARSFPFHNLHYYYFSHDRWHQSAGWTALNFYFMRYIVCEIQVTNRVADS